MTAASAVLSLTSHRGPLLLQTAHQIAKEAKPDTGDVDAAIILATASIEAFLNELGLFRDTPPTGPDARLRTMGQLLHEAEEGKAQIRLKYELAHFILAGDPVDRGSRSYQFFAELIRLRNDLIHFRPITGYDPAALKNNAHVRFFVASKVITESDLQGRVTWDRAIMKPSVARWAYNTARLSVANLIALMPQCRSSAELQTSWVDTLPDAFAPGA